MTIRKGWLIALALVGVAALFMGHAMGDREPPPDAKKAEQPSEQQRQFDVRCAGNTDVFVRLDRRTGECWVTQASDEEPNWRKIEEPHKLPNSEYELVPGGPGLNRLATLLRVDRKSGTAWAFAPVKWVKVKEPEK